MHIDEKVSNLKIYSENEMDIVENHIERHFGKFDEVFHEIVSPDIHIDICIIHPTQKHNYYTLVTMGMGAHEMNVPEKLRNKNTRAEILVSLPPDWNIKSDEEHHYWPLRWLKTLARLPIEENTWLGWGHTIPNGEPFAHNTRLSGMILELPYTFEKESMTCTLPNGETVNFYQMIPLYEEEMNFKIEQGTDALFECFDEGFTPVVDINRKNYLERDDSEAIGTPGKSFNMSMASRSAHVTPDLQRLKTYDIYRKKSTKDKWRTLFWGLLFGGITAFLMSRGYVWWSLLPCVIAFYNLFSLLTQLVATPTKAFQSGLLVPGLVVDVDPLKILVLAEMQTSEDFPVCWGLKMLKLKDWPDTMPNIGDKIPCVTLFGGSYKKVWTNMEPRPLLWGTNQPDVLTNAIAVFEEREWSVLETLKAKAMLNPRIEEDVMYFNEDLTEREV